MDHHCTASRQLLPIDLEFDPLLVAATVICPPPSTLSTSFSCIWPSSFKPGQPLRLRIPAIDHEIATDTLVIQCTSTDTGFLLTLIILDQEQAFKFRMLLQLSHIHHYHQQLHHQGRRTTLNEAAQEWIARFADSFPSMDAIA